MSPPQREGREREDEADRREQARKARADRIEAAAEIAASEFFVDRLAHRNDGSARAALSMRVVARHLEILKLRHAKIPVVGKVSRSG